VELIQRTIESFIALNLNLYCLRLVVIISALMARDQLMTAKQAATLKRLAHDAYELDAFKPDITSAEADIRIAMLTAKLKLLGEPPHTL
jgi:hypothetical protein